MFEAECAVVCCESVKEDNESSGESKESEPDNKTYITYFQSVTTLCVFTKAKNEIEASLIAKKQINNGDISNSLIDRMPFLLEKTEELKNNLT